MTRCPETISCSHQAWLPRQTIQIDCSSWWSVPPCSIWSRSGVRMNHLMAWRALRFQMRTSLSLISTYSSCSMPSCLLSGWGQRRLPRQGSKAKQLGWLWVQRVPCHQSAILGEVLELIGTAATSATCWAHCSLMSCYCTSFAPPSPRNVVLRLRLLMKLFKLYKILTFMN